MIATLDPANWTARAEAAENAQPRRAALDAVHSDMADLGCEYSMLDEGSAEGYRQHLEVSYARLLKAAQHIEARLSR